MSYRGKVVFEEIDEAARYVKVVGKGREKSGSGSATMTMESRLVALQDGFEYTRVRPSRRHREAAAPEEI